MENGSEPGSEPDVQAYSGDQLDEEDLRCQLAEKTNAINNLEQELRKVTARAENEAIALSAAVEVAEEHEGSNGDLQKHFNEAIAIASALEKKCEALTNEKIKSESKIATTVQDAEMQRSDIAELQKSLTAASEELGAKDEQLVESRNQITELTHQNEGLATIMAKDRQEGEYYMKRAQGLAGLLEGRPMAEEDKKMLEEKEEEIDNLRGYIGDQDEELNSQKAIIESQIPALTERLEMKSRALAAEIRRAEAWKAVDNLKAEALRDSQPDDLVEALKQEHRLLRAEN